MVDSVRKWRQDSLRQRVLRRDVSSEVVDSPHARLDDHFRTPLALSWASIRGGEGENVLGGVPPVI